MTEPRQRTLRDYLRVLRANRVVIVVLIVVCAGIAAAASLQEKSKYVATASVTFQNESLSEAEAGLPDLDTLTAAQLASQGATTMLATNVLSRVRSSLHTTLPISVLRGMLTTSVDPNSALVLVTATAGTGRFAARLANDVARTSVTTQTRAQRGQFAATAARVERQYDSERRSQSNPGSATNVAALTTLLSRIGTLQTLAANATPENLAVAATIPGSPSSPKPLRTTIFGGLVGLLLGIGIAFVRDLLDRRLSTSGEIQDALSLPVVGRVRVEAMGNAAYVGNGRGPMTDQDIESFRILRAHLDFINVDKSLKSILVSSPLAEEGKSTVAASLAAANAAAGKRTLLVECDLRRPCLSERLSINRTPGLSDYLAGRASPAEVLQVVKLKEVRSTNGASGDAPTTSDVEAGELVVITAGTQSIRPAELLGSERCRSFLEEVRTAYDTVVIDTPPLLAVADTLEIVPYADFVLLCIRAEQTTHDQACAAKDALPDRPEHSMAVVVTGLKPGREHDYGDYSYAYYGDR
jgi:capsular exopolysaccharide synthesis family protein